MDLPQRKHPRLKQYDYSENGYYAVTICTKDRKRILSDIVRRVAYNPPQIVLTDIGKIADKYIKNINNVYDGVSVDCYRIMPDHIHLIFCFDITSDNGVMRASRPTLFTVIRSLKTMITKEIKQPIWQQSFFDHIIRNKEDLFYERKYIDENPVRWLKGDTLA